MEIASEGGDPNEFGFKWASADIRRCEKDLKTRIIIQPQWMIDIYYLPIQQAFRENEAIIPNAREYRWLKEIDFSKFNDVPAKRLRRSLPARVVRKALRMLRGG